MIFQLVICLLFQEISFYYSHRLLVCISLCFNANLFQHWGPLYQGIHKIHHEFRAPVAMAAIYAHPLEFIFSNLVSIEIGPVICGSHFLLNLIWFTISTIGTLSHHSGYQRFWQVGGLDPRFHDYHHYSFIWHFGTLGLLDRIHGTINFKGFKEYRKIASDFNLWKQLNDQEKKE